MFPLFLHYNFKNYINVAAYTQYNLHNSIQNEKVTYFNANDVDTINYSH
jgi:hypothetical protein